MTVSYNALGVVISCLKLLSHISKLRLIRLVEAHSWRPVSWHEGFPEKLHCVLWLIRWSSERAACGSSQGSAGFPNLQQKRHLQHRELRDGEVGFARMFLPAECDRTKFSWSSLWNKKCVPVSYQIGHSVRKSCLEQKIWLLLELADRNDCSGKFTKTCGDSIYDCRKNRHNKLNTWCVCAIFSSSCFPAMDEPVNVSLTFVFFDNGVQKFSRLHNFSLCLRSQLKIIGEWKRLL